MEDLLDFLSVANRYHIEKVGTKIDGGYYSYIVSDDVVDLEAAYSSKEKKWDYFVKGVYNSGHSSAEIDMESLKNLVEFVNSLEALVDK